MKIRSNILALAIIILGAASAMAQGSTSYPVACAGSVVRYGTQGLPGSVYEWTVTGGQIIANYNDSIDVLWGNVLGTFAIQVIEHSEGECMGDPYLANINIKTPFVEIGDEVNICAGDTGTLVLTGNYLAYNWSNNNNTATTYEVAAPGMVWVEVMDENQCINRDSVEVKIHYPPQVNLGNDTILCGDEKLVLDGGDSGLVYRWSTGNTASMITVGEGEQTYIVKVTDEYCEAIDSIKILNCDDREIIKGNIPTAITPYNFDGHNDVFIISGLERYPETEVEIFDRWGRRIFKSDMGYTIPWDGTYNGKELPMDSYYYIINLKNGIAPIEGSVTIVK